VTGQGKASPNNVILDSLGTSHKPPIRGTRRSVPSFPSYTHAHSLPEKACSPLNLPDTQDIPLQLEICDLVRSKTVPPRAAMLSLRARIAAKNPRVQLAAWQLADVCIKNGGDHFLREVAGREFVDECVGVIKAGGNPQVGERARALWQSWALAFEGRPELALVTDTYRQLKAEGA
jgi:growth factor-regulated tyrosine kinase substrate